MAAAKDPVRLFDSNPPTDRALIHSLFLNCESEIAYGMSVLRSSAWSGKINAIHGQRRTGKSHLAGKLLLQAEAEKLPYITLTINANGQQTAHRTLEEVFFQLWHLILDIQPDQVPDGEMGVYELGRAYLSELEPLIRHDYYDVSFEKTSAALAGLGGKLGVGLEKWLQIGVEGKAEIREEVKQRWSQQRPSDWDLVNHISYEIDLLCLLRPGRRVLLLIDDLDLLEETVAGDQQESKQLFSYLSSLAQNQHLLLLATCRTAYHNGRDKFLEDLLKVPLMDDDLLAQIYQLRIDTFNAGEAVFDTEAFNYLVGNAHGKVGMFLHRCLRVARYYPHRRPIGLAELRGFIRKELQELRQESEHLPILISVAQAVREGKIEVELPLEAKDSGLLYWMFTPVESRLNVYRVDSLYADVLREGR